HIKKPGSRLRDALNLGTIGRVLGVARGGGVVSMRIFSLIGLLLVAATGAAQNASDSPLYVREGHCEATPPLRDSSPARWNGWGPTVTNTRFQDAAAGGITGADVPRLRLKWAYGLPREQQPRGQPAIIGGRMFVGSQAGA